MKKSILVFLLTMAAFTISSAQKLVEANPPSKLIDSVNAIYTEPQNLKWFLDDENNYIAKFKFNSQNVQMVFTEKGKYKETRTEISEKEMPSKIAKYVLGKYPSDMYVKNKFETIELVESRAEKFYYVTLKSTGVKDLIELWFKTNGELIRSHEPQSYKDKKAVRNPQDKTAIEDKIMKDDFTTEDDPAEETDPTEDLDKKKKSKK